MTRTLLLVLLLSSPLLAKPNVVLIMTDDQGYGDLSVTGNPVLKTPNIDRIATGGATMSRFYVSPVCTPTRASLMTGRYNQRTRAIDTFQGRAMMDPAEITVAEVLRDSGYATGIFGKWHLGDCYPMRAMDQGFSESLVLRGGGLRQPANPPDGDRYFSPILEHNGKPVRREGYCTDIFFNAALGFIESQHKAGKPFFTYIATNAPHGPLDEVPPGQLEKFKGKVPDNTAAVYAMVANIDENVGKLLAKLDELKIAENTLIIYMHDNGQAHLRYNAGLRGHKVQVFEGGIRSPFYARWPGVIPAGRTSDFLAAHIDVAPTILEACGLKMPDGVKLDGESLLETQLIGKYARPPKMRTLFFQWHRGNVPVQFHCFAVVMGHMKFVSQGNVGEETPKTEPKVFLFNLKNDPGEQKNIIGDYPQVAEVMKKEYEAWFKDVGSSRPDNYAPPRILVGGEHGNPTVLTFQDLRVGEQRDGVWWSNGSWKLHVEKEAKFTVRLRIGEPVKTTATVKLAFGGVTRETALKAGETQALFENFTLPSSDADLSIQIRDDQGNFIKSLYQVDVSW